MTGLLFVLAAGCVGLFIMKKLHCPSPAMIGSILVLGALSFYGVTMDYPETQYSFISKVIIGMLLGRRFTRDSLTTLKHYVAPAVVSTVWVVALSVLSGYIFHLTSGVKMDTALLSSAAGGLNEMTIIALAVGADVAIVLFVQLFRFFTVVMSTPLVAKMWEKKFGHVDSAAAFTGSGGVKPFRPFDYALLACLVLVCSWLVGVKFKVPAGNMMGGALGAAIAVLLIGRHPRFPAWMLYAAQIGVGASVARQLSHDTVLMIVEIFVSLILPTVVLLLGTYALVAVLYKVFKWDFVTSVLAASPGGLTQMVIMAEDMDCDVMRVGIIQLLRLFTIIASMPLILKAFS